MKHSLPSTRTHTSRAVQHACGTRLRQHALYLACVSALGFGLSGIVSAQEVIDHDREVVVTRHAPWTINNLLMIGSSGQGKLIVHDGGKVQTDMSGVAVGFNAGSTGAVEVTGIDSTFDTESYFNVGREGVGELTISEGGAVNSHATVIGAMAGSAGAVTVTGGGSILDNRHGYSGDGGVVVGLGGVGSLTIANHGHVKAPGRITIASQENSRGIVNIGAAEFQAATAPGELDTKILHFGDGEGTLLFNHTDDLDFAPVITGSGKIRQVNGSTRLAGISKYFTGDVSVENGTLKITGALGSRSHRLGTLGIEGGTLSLTDDGMIISKLTTVDSGFWVDEDDEDPRLDVAGANAFLSSQDFKIGEYNDGELAISDGGYVHSLSGVIGAGVGANGSVTITGKRSTWFNGNLINISDPNNPVDSGPALVVGSKGTGQLTISDSGRVEAQYGITLAADGQSSGTINIGATADQDAVAPGTLVTPTLSFGEGDGTLLFNHTGDLDFASAIRGEGTIDHVAGTTRLTGASSGFDGTTVVKGGKLEIVGTLGGDATVSNGGELTGGGVIGSDVAIEAGGVLSNHAGKSLTIGNNLVLSDGAQVNVALGGPNTTALFNVGNDLTLDGTLNITDTGGFGSGEGVYLLMNYSGNLINNTMEIGTAPGAWQVSVQTSEADQVNLVAKVDDTLNFWDGGDTHRHNNGEVDGGDGTWSVDSKTWTDMEGKSNAEMSPTPGFAIFQGLPGTVTLNETRGWLEVSGLQFAVNGYTLQGDLLNLANDAILRVGNGSAAGARYIATLSSDSYGSGDVTKRDLGTLVLNGNLNTFQDLNIRNGAVDLINGARVVTSGDVLVGTHAGASGTLTVTSGGNVETTGGEIKVANKAASKGTVNIGAAAGQASAAAGMLNTNTLTFGDGDGTLVFNHTGTSALNFAPAIKGPGLIEHMAGETRLAGDSTEFTGDVQVTGGALEITNALGGAHEAMSNLILKNGGTARLTGNRAWLNGTGAAVGVNDGSSTLIVSDGGRIDLIGGIGLGVDDSSSGTVTVTGAGSTLRTNGGDSQMVVGFAGAGTLTITNGGLVDAGGGFFVANNAGSKGTVNIGAAADQAPAAGGTLNTNTLTFVEDEGTLVFNHTGTSALNFAPAIKGPGLIKHMAGSTRLAGDSNGFTGDVQVTGGALEITNTLGGAQEPIQGGLSIKDGSVRLSNGAQMHRDTLHIDTGELAIINSGVANFFGGFVDGTARSPGLVIVSGANSSWNSGSLIVGDQGAAQLHISKGAHAQSERNFLVARGKGSKGDVEISDAESWLSTFGRFTVGVGGTGTLTLSSGGRLFAHQSLVGDGRDSSGRVMVTGEGSRWDNYGMLTVGNHGAGELNIANDGWVVTNDLMVANSPTSTGAVTVTDNARLELGGLSVGEGGTGKLSIDFGGEVQSRHGLIGYEKDSSGEVKVHGVGSTWENFEDISVGRKGSGKLDIHMGGRVQLGGTLGIGGAPGSNGYVNISGVDSTLTADLAVGYGGLGLLNIYDKATVVSGDAQIGVLENAEGTVKVTGTDSTWTVENPNFLVGVFGAGHLMVSGGGSVNSEDAVIGGNATGRGTATVTGPGSSWSDTGNLLVGSNGAGTLTLSGEGHVEAGAVTIARGSESTGFLNIGAAARDRTVVAGILDTPTLTFGRGDGTLVFNHAGTLDFAPAISGEGTIDHVAGITRLTGTSFGFSGTTTMRGGELKIVRTLGGDAEVEGGRLTVGGRLIGDATVRNGGELTGGGVIGGDVAIDAGGVLSGRSGRTLNIKGDLTLVSGSEVDVALGAPSDDRLFKVDGDLTLDGTLNVTDGGGFGRGTYRLFDYGGNLIDNVLDIGTVPATWDHEIQTSVAQQVNLVIDDDDDDDDKNKNKNKNNHWDGDDDNQSACVTRPGGSPDDCSRHNNGQIDGGNGTWTATSENWTTTDGTSNGAMSSPGFAIFQGAAGTVTVDNGLGAAGVTGMQFATNGYVVQGDPIELVSLAGETPLIRVGDGTAAGAQLTATLRADLMGGSAVTKHDLGTLVLDGNASAFGDTGIKQGAMHLIGGGTVDSTTVSIGVGAGDAGALAVEGTGSMWTSEGLDVGAGGTGELAISGGGTVSSSGGTIGSQAGGSGTATVGGSGSTWGIGGGGLSVGGGGSGGLTISGGGWVSASGGVTLARAAGSTGTLNIGAAAGQAATAAGTLDTDTLTFGDGNGTLVFNHTGTLDFDPAIEGTGTITHEAGNTRLTSDSSGFSGTTTVGNGELEIVRALGGDATVQAGGHLSVGGSLGGSATVHGGGILGGGGHIGGDVTIEAGGVLSGSEDQTLSVAGDFILDEEALVNPAQVEVGGNLTLDGTMQVTETGGAGPGVYQLFDYNGTITDHGLKVEAPAGAPDFTVQTAVANRVNLVSTAGETLNFWDGSDTSRHHNDAVDGGDGTWTATSQTWADVDGAGNGAMTPKPSFAVFQATPGTVTLDDSHGTLSVTGLQFAKDGYTLQGDGLALTDGAIVRVGNGSKAGARHVAWVHSDLTGGAVTKHDRGTLMLAGNTSTFSNVDVRGGEVRLARAGTADSATVSIGVDVGETGALTVKGARSVWTGDAFLVGAGGAGELTISGGGTVQSSAGRLGYATGASGTATVTGPGSTWANDKYLLVGADGMGRLAVSGGATVRSAEGIIGSTAGASGTVTIDGPASNWTNTGGLLVGAEGSGELTLSGGLASASSGVILAQVAGSTGVLNIGAAAGQEAKAAGTLDTGILIFGAGDGSLVFNHRSDLDFAPVLAGTGTVVHEAGNTRLTGASPGFDGTTTVRGGNLKIIRALGGDAEVQGGRLTVGGRLIGDASVRSGGELTGGGVIGGDVALESGGVLAGRTGRTLRVKGDLTLTEGARVDVALGAPDASALFGVGGDLTLDGTLDVSDAGGFGEGVYRLFDYQGELTDNGLVLGATPEGQFDVQTAVANQVNLLSTVGAGPVPSGGFAATVGRYSPALLLTPVLQFWDGSAAGNADNGAIDGGAGTWTADGTTWTDVDGASNGAMNPSPGFAIFQGQAGTITLDAGAGALEARGLQFADDGYGLEGDSLTLTEAHSTLRVGDGTDAGAAMTATIAADLDAAGTVRKTDLGTLVLTGANTWGGADIATGTLQLAEGGSATTGAVTIGYNPGETGTLAIGADSSWTSSDEVQAGFGGTGTVRLHDGGTLSTTGLQLAGFDGSTGTLVIGAAAGEDASAAGTLEAATVAFGEGAGTLVFNHTDSDYDFTAALFSGVDGTAIDGAGAVQHLAGTTVLSGESSGFSGHTEVAGGRLQVDGTLGGTLAIGAGGTLAGTGTVGTVDNAGTVAPGNSIGTLTIDGDYVHRAGATLLAEIEPGGTSDLLEIAGTATLEGGEVSVLKAPGQYQGQTRYILLDAARGVSGTFDTLTQNSPFLDLALAYDAQHVFLDVTRNSTDFGIVCASGTFNQCQVGTTLDAIGEGEQPPTLELQAALAEASTLSLEQAQAAFDRLSGEAHASLSGLVLEGHALHGQSVTRRLVDRREAVGMTALQGGSWARGYGQRSELDGDGNAHGADLRVHGLAVGMDAWATESWLVGASLNTMQLDADLRPGDRGRADSHNVSLYTSVQGERAYLDGVVSYAWWDNEVERAVQLGAIASRAKADYDGHRFATYLEAGYRFELGAGQQLQPLVSVQYDKVDQAGFREDGAGDLDLVGRSHDVDRLTVGAGLRWQGRFQRGDWTLQPSAQARWLHGAGDAHAELDVALAGAPEANFRVRGVELPRNRGVLGVGLTADKGDQLQLFVNYDYQHGDRGYRAHQLGASVRWRW